MPAEFLAFSLLPGIERARYRWLHIVDGTSGDGNLCIAYSLITEIKLVSAHLNFAVGLDYEVILTVKFSG